MLRVAASIESTIRPAPTAVPISILSPIINRAATSAMIGSKFSTIEVNAPPMRLILWNWNISPAGKQHANENRQHDTQGDVVASGEQ